MSGTRLSMSDFAQDRLCVRWGKLGGIGNMNGTSEHVSQREQPHQVAPFAGGLFQRKNQGQALPVGQDALRATPRHEGTKHGDHAGKRLTRITLRRRRKVRLPFPYGLFPAAINAAISIPALAIDQCRRSGNSPQFTTSRASTARCPLPRRGTGQPYPSNRHRPPPDR